jgi:hypothetical protein
MRSRVLSIEVVTPRGDLHDIVLPQDLPQGQK